MSDGISDSVEIKEERLRRFEKEEKHMTRDNKIQEIIDEIKERPCAHCSSSDDDCARCGIKLIIARLEEMKDED